MAGNRIAGLGLAVAVVAGILWLLVEPRVAPPIEPGHPAPAFDLPRLDGSRLRLGDLEGRVVLVNFWATWCKPCEEEMPAMERLYQALRDRGFELVAISVDTGSDEVRTYQERLGFTFPVLLDPDKEAAADYQSFRYPESYLVGRDGLLIERYVGPREWDAPAYVARIERLLGS